MSPSLALLASLALLLGACQAPAASDSQDGLRPITLALGYRPDVQFAPFYVAQREGVFINIANRGLFDTPLMFVALATLAIIGLAFYGLVVIVERRLLSH